jgi:nitroreductase
MKSVSDNWHLNNNSPPEEGCPKGGVVEKLIKNGSAILMNILTAIKARFSTRAFLIDPVPEKTLQAILEAARFSPSGKNTQPWHVAAVTGETLEKLSTALLQAFQAKEAPRPDYQYYLTPLPSLFKKHAINCGAALYGALGIDKADLAGRDSQWARNYEFFNAPACFFIFLDPFTTQGSFMDVGMFMQNIMLAALDFELATCPQASLGNYPDVVKNMLGPLFKDKLLVGGISIGYPDLTHPVNQYRTEREKVENFTTFYN